MNANDPGVAYPVKNPSWKIGDRGPEKHLQKKDEHSGATIISVVGGKVLFAP
jgi:hypothetical protein